jgi:hypothetical protein
MVFENIRLRSRISVILRLPETHVDDQIQLESERHPSSTFLCVGNILSITKRSVELTDSS